MNIPLVDLKRQYQAIKNEIDEAVQCVVDDTDFILGKHTQDFEAKFAKYCGANYCVGLNSGTDALFMAFLAIGLKAGDEIITAPNTFFATTEYLGHLGARPVFVDVDQATHLIDADKIESAITDKTKAIIPVHLYGQMADMDKILAIAMKYHLSVIEDCAQAHGAQYKGQKAGSIGDIGAYSFYPGKNLGAYGDAGCIVTNNEQHASFIKKFRNHGRASKYEHDQEAYSSRMDGLQASILDAKLAHLDEWIEKRRLIAQKYNKLLKNVETPVEISSGKHSYHLYVIATDSRDELLGYLKSKGVEAGIHYPIPLHLQKAYEYLNLPVGSLPISERAAGRVLSLPIFPELTDKEINYVADCVNEFFAQKL